MGTQNTPFAHVYHRIAEHVNKELIELGVNIDATLVEDVIEEHAHMPLNPKVEAAIRSEAKEYGLELPDVELSEYEGDGSDLSPEQFATWSKKYGEVER